MSGEARPRGSGPPLHGRVPTGRVLREGLRVASDALRANWMRTVLAVLGVGIGVGVVVTMASIITGIRSEVMTAFEASGPRNFVLMPFDFSDARAAFSGSGRPPWWNRPRITDAEVGRVQSLPAVAEAVAGFEFAAALRYRSEWVWSVPFRGFSGGWASFMGGDFVAGRDFTPTEVSQARGVMVVSSKLAENLFGELDPVGKRVRVNAGRRASNELFTIVGVFEPLPNMLGEATENFAHIPFTAADKRLKARTRWNFLSVQIMPKETARQAETENQVVAALRSMRALGPREDNNFAIIRSEDMIDLFNQLTGMFFVVMVGLSSVGMLVGGIGVVGIMLISVTERTREIGVRKSIGATRREIKWQFLIEASLMTAAGAGAGLLAGWAASEGIAAATPLPSRIPLWSVFAAIGLAALTGILFGMMPALRASRLPPVDALRHE
ncbi:MAG: ABC transporter permease [Gemmatimonadota bacterium]|nr:ABC transporter permease [Gemmatimonadota bacterium]